VKHDVGSVQNVDGPDRQQIRCAGTRPDEVDFTALTTHSSVLLQVATVHRLDSVIEVSRVTDLPPLTLDTIFTGRYDIITL